MLGDCFDPKGEVAIREHCRPHWSQAGAVVFITFRTADSIPRSVVEAWNREKQLWLQNCLGRSVADVQLAQQFLSPADHVRYRQTFGRQREMFLDTCHGECLLRDEQLAAIVAKSLLHFDGQRYCMGDFVVMPNHVHLLAVFPTAEAMHRQCDSWMHFTAHEINKAISRTGKLWQEEPFDHLVRSPEQYDYLRRYLAENPQKAKLRAGEYLYRRYPD